MTPNSIFIAANAADFLHPPHPAAHLKEKRKQRKMKYFSFSFFLRWLHR